MSDISGGGRHSRVPSLASVSSERWMGTDPPYKHPWLNRLAKVFIWCHNSVLVPFVLAFTSALYAAISQALGRPRCPTPDPSDGAIIVLNSTAGIGRDIALALASRGWTVFAYGESRDQSYEVLSPTRGTGPSFSSLDLSMLLYLWHRRNERRQTSPRNFSTIFGSPLPRTTPSPGTIVPISSRTDSSTLLSRLHFVQSSAEESPRPAQQGECHFWTYKQTSVTGAQQVDYEMNLQSRLSEPLLVTKELLPLLRRNHGRVIFVEGCGDSNIFTRDNLESVLEGARLSAVDVLRKELRNAVKVSLVHTGPLLVQAQRLLLDNVQVHSEAPTQTTKEEVMQRDIQAVQTWRSRFLAQYLYCLGLQPSNICASVQQALVSAHPRPVYHVGLLALSPTAILEQFFMLSVFSTVLRSWIGLEV